MKKIPMQGLHGSGKYLLIDDENYDLYKNHTWCVATNGYLYAPRLKTYLHRLVMDAVKGDVIDHINRDKLDNRRANLRKCEAKNNAHNQALRSTNSSGYKGVSYFKRDRNWRVQIVHDYQTMSLGYFDSPEEAAVCYDAAAIQLFDDYAYLNIIGRG